MNTPAQTVLQFIVAYHDWNDRASSHSKVYENGSEAARSAIQAAEHEYSELINRFCMDSVTPQPISFGDDPMHGPASETIEHTDIDGETAIVRTKNIGMHDFVSEYEYHLKHSGDQWRIDSVLYMDEDGKHECL